MWCSWLDAAALRVSCCVAQGGFPSSPSVAWFSCVSPLGAGDPASLSEERSRVGAAVSWIGEPDAFCFVTGDCSVLWFEQINKTSALWWMKHERGSDGFQSLKAFFFFFPFAPKMFKNDSELWSEVTLARWWVTHGMVSERTNKKTTRSLNTTSCVFAACLHISLQVGWFCNLNTNPLHLHQLQTLDFAPSCWTETDRRNQQTEYLSSFHLYRGDSLTMEPSSTLDSLC